jgi:hypothetical protein
MSRRKENQAHIVSWRSEMLDATEENLSPLYSFHRDHDFQRFEDVQGKTGWVVGVYDSIPQECGREAIPFQLVVYYDVDGLAVIDPSRVFYV